MDKDQRGESREEFERDRCGQTGEDLALDRRSTSPAYRISRFVERLAEDRRRRESETRVE